MKKSFSSYAIPIIEYLREHRPENVLLFCSLVYILLAISSVVFDGNYSDGKEVYLFAAIIELAVIAIPSIVYYSLRSTNGKRSADKPDVGMRKIGKDKIFFIILASFLLISGATAINAIIARLGVAPSSGILDLEGSAEIDMWLKIISLALIPALSEEFLCRGLIMGEARKLGALRALIISSLCFAMLHFNFARFPLYLLCGFILGLIMIVTDSIIAATVAHFIFNLFSILSGSLLTAISEQIGDLIILFFLSALIFIICAIFTFKEITRIFAGYARHPEIAPRFAALRAIELPTVSLFGVITPALALCVLLYSIFAIFIR